MIRRPFTAALLLGALAGCLGKPETEDRWTRIDFVDANVAQGQSLPADSSVSIVLRTAVTYRSVLTGFLVTEVRASGTLSRHGVEIGPDAPREEMGAAIEQVLANSVSVGRATRAVTGWDHLIQETDQSFEVRVPSAIDSSGAPIGVFLVSYLGEGEEVELEDGRDSLIVTPFPFRDYEILPIGLELDVE
jgi:hypothetical protein